MNYRNAEIEVSYRPPGSMEWQRWRIPISEFIARDLRPLPRDRELPFAIGSQCIAREMTQRRTVLAKDLTPLIQSKLEEMISAGDPINGYSPEQWAEYE